jgi:hypothetical protein
MQVIKEEGSTINKNCNYQNLGQSLLQSNKSSQQPCDKFSF